MRTNFFEMHRKMREAMKTEVGSGLKYALFAAENMPKLCELLERALKVLQTEGSERTFLVSKGIKDELDMIAKGYK